MVECELEHKPLHGVEIGASKALNTTWPKILEFFIALLEGW